MSGQVLRHGDDRQSRLTGQIQQRRRLAQPELEQGRAARSKYPMQIREKFTIRIKAIGPAIQGKMRLVQCHLRHQVSDIGGLYVGRIA